MAARISAFTSLVRNVCSPRHSFIVTSTGKRVASFARFLCETPARSPRGLRPAPRRLPPQLTNPNSR
jgi:hypothetical protein